MHKLNPNDLNYVRERGYDPKAWVPCPRGEKGKINPQVSKMYLGNDQWISVFYSKVIYYEDRLGYWKPLEDVCEYHGNQNVTLKLETLHKIHPRFLEWLEARCEVLGGKLTVSTPWGNPLWVAKNTYISAGLTTSTFYPAPDSATSTVDGYVLDFATTGTWSTSHDYATGNSASSTATSLFARADKAGAGSTFLLYRSHLNFDTSSIGTDNVDSATLSLYGFETADGQSDAAGITGSTVTGTSVATTDFDSYPSIHSVTPYSSIAISSISNVAYNDFTLNAAGESNINTSGISPFGLRTALDYAETTSHSNAPTASSNFFRPYSANQSGTTSSPKLVVVHTAAGGGGFAYSQAVIIT